MSPPDPTPLTLDLGQTIRGLSANQKVVGRYLLVRILGRGGMGVVWLARDEKLHRDVALKFLPELVVHDEAVLDDLKRETNRSLELTHPHIVRIHDFVDDVHYACISMEYVDGPTLSALRVQRPAKVFEVDELAPWIKQTCEALDYAHNRARIVHRDLKPANLMLNARGDLKVADFGVARSLSDSISMLTMSHGTSGTLVYMSPQQLNGERASPLDDIYSLGAAIYELIASKPPFYSGDITAQINTVTPPLMRQRRDDLGVGGAAIPVEWEETVASCLAKDPAQRPQSAKEVAERLAGERYGFLATTVNVQKTQEAPPLPVTPGKGPSWKIVGPVAVGILSFLGLFVFYYTSRDEPAEKANPLTTNAESEHFSPTPAISPTPSASSQTQAAAVTFPTTEPRSSIVKDRTALNTDAEKGSYAIGHDIGTTFKKQSVELNSDVFFAGFKDALAGKEAMKKEDRDKVLADFQQKMAKKQAEQSKVAGEKNATIGEKFLAENKRKEGVKTTASGLQYKVLKEGSGPSPKESDTVVTNYRGTLIDGTEFDSSYKRNEPASFPVSRVIKGWTEALQLMKPGGKYQLFIPANLAYGDRGVGKDIGPNSTLIFEVELLSIKPPDAASPRPK